MTSKVVIIGAGWSGAVAARKLADAGFNSITVLEARDRVGGRARSVGQAQGLSSVKDSNLDMGCSFIHGYHQGNPATQLAKDLNVDVTVAGANTNAIVTDKGVLSQEKAGLLRKNFAQALGSSIQFAKQEEIETSTSLASALFSPTSSLFEGLDDQEKKYAQGLARWMEGPWGTTAEEASLKYFGWEDNFSGSDASVNIGYQNFVGKVLQGIDVKLNTAVSGIHNKEGQGVEIETRNGEKFKADYVICTIPLGVLQNLPTKFFEPALPKSLTKTIANTNMGLLEKVALSYDKPWWDDFGSFTVLQDKVDNTSANVSDYTLQAINFASSKNPRAHATLLVFIPPGLVKAVANLSGSSSDYLIQNVHKRLAERLPKAANTTTVPEPTGGLYSNWYEDEFTRGATTSTTTISQGPGIRDPSNILQLGKPIWNGRLCFAGEHTEPNHRGSVAGAVVSGMREADRVINRLVAEKAKI